MRRAVVLLLALAGALSAPRQLHARDIIIRDYRAEVVVNRDGTVDVTETLRVRFEGSWNGIYRDISLQHQTGQGRRAKLDIDDITVTDQSGFPLEFWREKPNGWTRRVRVRVPGAADAERTVVIHYRVNNGVRFFFPGDAGGEHDELYWNVTGNEWDFPIQHVFTRLVLPDGVYPVQEAAYTGIAGSRTDDATVRASANTVTAEVTRTLEPREGLTLAVAWPAGALPRPSEAEVRAERALTYWPIALPFLALLLMGRHWWRHGRDPGERAITVVYEPPEGMTPAEIGTLVDNSADLSDITSTLVDLAVRGYVGIEEVEEKHLLGLMKSTDWAFHLLTDATDGLQPHERSFLDALFAGAANGPAWSDVRRSHAMQGAAAGGVAGGWSATGTPSPVQPEVRLSALKNRFYRSLPGIRSAIFSRLIERGYYLKRPDTVKGFWSGGGIFLAMLMGAGASRIGDAGWSWVDPLTFGIAGAACGVIVFVFGLQMAARTEKGARAREAALGFGEFLEKVESDRYRRMITSPELFERYLPHAMAFGVASRWARAFEDLYHEPPGWYAGSGYHSFSVSSFSAQMSGMSSSAATAMSSSPSGSGGGGSSGGGSGGGGGGGW